jgi:GNAT superfamily N-acetyltransferase
MSGHSERVAVRPVREWFVRSLLPASDTRVAESAGGEVVGVLVIRDGWVHQLYVAEQWTGRGAGAALLEAAQAGYEQLSLWTFVSNPRAQRFYERHGFVEVERTDGAGNEEGQPDIRYVWRR